jgi:hypothetical protein
MGFVMATNRQDEWARQSQRQTEILEEVLEEQKWQRQRLDELASREPAKKEEKQSDNKESQSEPVRSRDEFLNRSSSSGKEKQDLLDMLLDLDRS